MSLLDSIDDSSELVFRGSERSGGFQISSVNTRGEGDVLLDVRRDNERGNENNNKTAADGQVRPLDSSARCKSFAYTPPQSRSLSATISSTNSAGYAGIGSGGYSRLAREATPKFWIEVVRAEDGGVIYTVPMTHRFASGGGLELFSAVAGGAAALNLSHSLNEMRIVLKTEAPSCPAMPFMELELCHVGTLPDALVVEDMLNDDVVDGVSPSEARQAASSPPPKGLKLDRAATFSTNANTTEIIMNVENLALIVDDTSRLPAAIRRRSQGSGSGSFSAPCT